jgi:hypothetical protein
MIKTVSSAVGRFTLLRWAVMTVIVGIVAFAQFVPALWSQTGIVRPDLGRVGRAIPADYFGLTINEIGLKSPWPALSFSGVRLWGAIYWAEFNPAPGVFNWTRFDAILDVAQRHNVDVIFNLAYTPQWAASVKDAAPGFSPGASSPPADIRYWEDFVQAAVKRAAGRIRYWEVWNEPEDPIYYSGDIASMVRLQQRAFEIIKGVDPTLMVITPSSNGTAKGFRWQEAFLAAGGGKFADILGFHGYWDNPNPEAMVGIIERFKQLFAAYGLAGKPVWDTEGGWPATLSDPDAQASYVARSYLLQWSFGVDRFYWYAYEGGGATWGKLWDRGRGVLAPGIAYRTVYRWLAGSVILHELERSGPVWRIELRLQDGRKAIAVWTTGRRMAYASPSGYARLEDLYGSETPIRGSVEIGPKPVLLISARE